MEDEHICPYKHVEIDGVSGISCHHLIAPHLTRWISADCAVQVGIILNNLLIQKWQDQVYMMTLTQRHYESVINDWRNKVDDKNELLAVKEEQINELNQRLDWTNTHAFTLVRTNSDDCLPYYAMSCLRRTVNTSLKRLRLKNPHAEVLFQQK